MAEETRLHLKPAARPRDRRMFILFILVGIAFIVLLVNLAGSRKTWELVAGAHPLFVGCILVLQAFRYVSSAGSTAVLAGIFKSRVPFFSLYETMVAGQALNRTFSAGGAAGMWARYSFMTRQGMHSGPFAALLVVEDLIGAFAIFIVFCIGLAAFVATSTLPDVAWLVLAGFGVGIVVLGVGVVSLYRHRPLVEWLVHTITRTAGAILARIIGKEVYRRERMEQIVDEFYIAVSQARTDPPRLLAAFLFNILRLALDAASLYFAFWAVGFAISPGICLVIFTSSSAVSTLSAAPGELAVMETSLAVLATSLGIANDVAISAILLFRALSYWLPIPVGYLALWHLERKGEV
ncbi:MAG: lysylphosphatidylglycerol synthase transmembrane domain-containing protein [Anaerolineae bacterium]